LLVRWFVLGIAVSLASGCTHLQQGSQEPVAENVNVEAYAAPLSEPALFAPDALDSNAVPTKAVRPGVARPHAAWQHFKLPGKTPSQFRVANGEGRKSIKVSAKSSTSMLRYKLRLESNDLAAVKFSWKVPMLIQNADLADRDLDDAPVRVVLAFEGDRSKFSARNAMLSELSNALTGEPMPYATLMYVWCNTRTPGTVVNNPRTDRIRKMVVESGGKNLNRWMDYERDIRADFIKAFGEEPGALLGVALMTDTDNTRSETTAWYGPVSLGNAQGGMVTKALQK
jgi:Protein of unknown function (DUF3047)